MSFILSWIGLIFLKVWKVYIQRIKREIILPHIVWLKQYNKKNDTNPNHFTYWKKKKYQNLFRIVAKILWKKYHCISELWQNCLNGFLIFETKYTHYRFHRRYDQRIQLTQLISIYIKLHYDTRFAKKIYWRYACVILPTILKQKNQKKILPFESSAYYLRILKKKKCFFLHQDCYQMCCKI